MKKTIFQSLSQKQKRLTRNAIKETSFARLLREPTKAELRELAEQAFKTTAEMQKGKAA